MTPEKIIENSIIEFLNMQPGCFAFKVQTTGMYDPKKGIFRKPGKYVIKGTSDIIGICNGRFFAMEVKSDGTKKPSQEQITFLRKVRNCGGIAGVVFSVETAKELLYGTRLVSTDQEDNGTGPTQP